MMTSRRGTGARLWLAWVPLLITAAAVIVLYLLWDILSIFLLAAFLAFILHPAVNTLSRRFPRVMAITIVYLTGAILLITVAGLLAPLIADQFRGFSNSLPIYLSTARRIVESARENYLGLPASWRDIATRALTELQDVAIRLTRQSIPAFFGLLASLFGLILIPLLSFFMLLGSSGYWDMLVAILPRSQRQNIVSLVSHVGRALWTYIRGQLALMTAVGVLTGLGLYIVGMPYPAVFGILAGLLELIPTFGPWVTTIVVAGIGFTITPLLALRAGLVTIIVQFLENLFLVPVIMSQAVGLDPVTIAFSIFIGSRAGGALGTLMAIPIALMIKVVILHFYVEHRPTAHTPGPAAFGHRASRLRRRHTPLRREAPP